jgi:CDP-glucose 4,6-dehydratase
LVGKSRCLETLELNSEIEGCHMTRLHTTDWTKRNVLVTGATGIVGSQLVRRLLDLAAHVVCFVRDHDPASSLWFEGDIDRVSISNGRLEVFEHVKAAIVEREVDTIFHLGAQAIVGVGQRDPLGTFESNIRGTYHVLEACRLYGDRVKRIVIASSDKAYGDCESLPYTEDTPLAARNPYDVSKSCADLISQSYAASYGMPIAIARCGNIFGPGDLNWSRLVPGTIRSLLSSEQPIIRSDGTLVRDYLFVEDAANAYLAMADWLDDSRSANASQRAFNFSSNQPLNVLDMTRMIQRACGRIDLEPIVQNQAIGEIRSQHLDSSRAQTELNWAIKHDLASALKTTVEWYRTYLTRSDRESHSLVLPRSTATRARVSA